MIGDIFESFFGGQGGPGGGRRRSGPTQGDDLRFDLEIDFQTALFGGSKKIRITHLETCGTCTGSGVAPGSSVTQCSTCGGRGVVVQTVNTILGRMQQQARCPHGTLVVIMLGLPAARVDSASVPTSCVSFVTRGAPRPTNDGAGQKSAQS